jgi:hypothetical protein
MTRRSDENGLHDVHDPEVPGTPAARDERELMGRRARIPRYSRDEERDSAIPDEGSDGFVPL